MAVQYPRMISRVSSIRREYTAMLETLNGPGFALEIPLTNLRWALEVASSRALGLLAGTGADQATMCPLHDMFNHVCDEDIQLSLHHDETSMCYRFYTPNRAWKEGEEVLLSYGSRCNDHLALCYFFCPPNNPHDIYWVEDLESELARLDQTGPHRIDPGRLSLIMSIKPEHSLCECQIRRDGVDALSFLRIQLLVGTDQEYEQVSEVVELLAEGYSHIDEEEVRSKIGRKLRFSGLNDAAAHAVVAALCDGITSSMPTTLAQDRELQRLKLASDSKSESGSPLPPCRGDHSQTDEEGVAADRYGMALDFRIGKKELLEACSRAEKRRSAGYTRLPFQR